MTPCILIVYNAFTEEHCCLHARSDNPGTTSIHAYEITAPEHVINNFDDSSEWDIIAVIEPSGPISGGVSLADLLRIHIDEIDVTEGSAPKEDDE